jgi:mono/diheme cytochrome c family protein
MHGCLLLYMCLTLGLSTLSAASDDRARRGEYIFRAAGCASCHTDRGGAFLAGGRALQTRFGVFYSPNITPHPDDGIGRWSDDDFVRALTEGISPQGAHYYPAFPYSAYTRMHRDDILALSAYLSTVPAVARKNRPHEPSWYVSWRPLIALWKRLYFERGEFRADSERSERWNRGAYLANVLAHCGECHTPRTALGALDNSLHYAGTLNGPEGEAIPNITPARKTGIGRWSENDLAYYLETGARPDGDYAGSLMAEVIDDGLRYLNEADINALVTYVRSIAPIERLIKRKKKAKRGEYE